MIRTLLIAGAAALAAPALAQTTIPETDDILPPQTAPGIQHNTDPEVTTGVIHGLDRAPAAGADIQTAPGQTHQHRQTGPAQDATDPHGAPPAVRAGAGHAQTGAVGATGPTGMADQPGVTGQRHTPQGMGGPLLGDGDIDADWRRYDPAGAGGLDRLAFGTWLLGARGQGSVQAGRGSSYTEILNATALAHAQADRDRDGRISRDELHAFVSGD